MKDDKLIFWTGAPGSKWSATAWCLSKTKKIDIDTTDQAEHRCYVVDDERWPGVRHVGSYFGPGFEFGQKFHKINTLTKKEIKEEINKAFDGQHPEKYKIVRCHQFVHNLDWIRDNFPESKIVIVWRKPEASWNGWITAGGFDITHPNYREYYKDEQTAKTLIYEEAYLGSKWMFDNDMDIHIACKSHYTNYWDISFTDSALNHVRQIEGWFKTWDNPYAKIKYDVLMGYYNF